jgi:hypothetical protein
VNNTKMKDVILRHYPQLAPALEGLPNAFLPWHRVGGEDGRVAGVDGKVGKRIAGTRRALGAINSDASAYAGQA